MCCVPLGRVAHADDEYCLIDEVRLARLKAFDQQADQALAVGNFKRLVEANFDFHRCLYEARPGTIMLPGTGLRR